MKNFLCVLAALLIVFFSAMAMQTEQKEYIVLKPKEDLFSDLFSEDGEQKK